jgi:hypothetical protein
MQALVLTAIALALAAAPAARAAELTDAARQAAFAADLKPFDAMQSQGWQGSPPLYRTTAEGKPDGVRFALQPGSYMIVAKCHCEQMDVTLVTPDAAEPKPLRASAQAALYSLDVTAPGTYLTGVDMDACQAKSCDFVVKVYRKK